MVILTAQQESPVVVRMKRRHMIVPMNAFENPELQEGKEGVESQMGELRFPELERWCTQAQLGRFYPSRVNSPK